MTVYLIYLVTYDWHRFEIVQYVTRHKDKADRLAKQMASANSHHTVDESPIDIYEYEDDADEIDDLDEQETCHVWIRKMKLTDWKHS